MARQHRRRKAKVNIPLCAAAVLLYLTVLSGCLVSGLLARYTTRAQGGDEARVAKFSVTGSGTLLQTIETDLVPGEERSVELRIENNSEVSVEYTVTATNETKNLPLTFWMEKKETSAAMGTTGTTFTAQRLPGNHTDEYILHIEWPQTENDLEWVGMVDHIAVTVTAAQID